MLNKIERFLVKIFSLKIVNFLGVTYYFLRPKRKSYSQYGEDLIILNFFESIGLKNNGYYLDIGAYHPTFISNTHLLHINGWRGVCVDLSSEKLKWFKLFRRSQVKVIRAAISNQDSGSVVSVFKHKRLLSEIDTLDREVAIRNKVERNIDFVEEKIKTLSINDLLAKVGREIDFLNIDIEGMDSHVLSAIDFKIFRPKCILFEDNKNFGGSKLVVNLLEGNGYRHLFSSRGSVAFFHSSCMR